MRGFELLDKMGLASPGYLEAAEKSPDIRKRGRLMYRAIAACLCAAVLLLFRAVPNPGNCYLLRQKQTDRASFH